jgi:cytochrome c-type biogenesis protein CcmH
MAMTTRNGFARLLLLLALGFACPAHAGEAASVAADPALEDRMMALASELRCLVCQNQTLADSQAPLAVDLRDQIREKLRQGASEHDIVEYMVARYGDFVLYRPPFKATTVLLWAGPLLLLLTGMATLLFRLARRRAEPRADLTAEEHARAAALLESGRDGESR